MFELTDAAKLTEISLKDTLTLMVLSHCKRHRLSISMAGKHNVQGLQS